MTSKPFAASIALAATAAFCGGSLNFGEVQQIMQTNPKLAQAFAKEFESPDSAFADIRLGDGFKNLSGARMGPYHFLAKRKGQLQGEPVEIVVCTRVKFLSKGGQLLRGDAQFSATRLDERTVSFFVQGGNGSAQVACPQTVN